MFGSQLLCGFWSTQLVFALVDVLVEVEDAGELTLKGFHRPVAACSVIKLRTQSSAETQSPLPSVGEGQGEGGPAAEAR